MSAQVSRDERAALAEDAPGRRRRKLTVVLAGAGLVALGLVVSGPWLASGWATGQAKRLIEARINGSVEIERVHLSWLGSQRVRGLVVDDAQGRRVATLTESSVGRGLLGLLGGLDTLGTLSVEGEIHVYQEPDGSLSISELLKSPPRAGPGQGRGGGPRETGPTLPSATLALPQLRVVLHEAGGSETALTLTGAGHLDADASLTVDGSIARDGVQAGRIHAHGTAASVNAALRGDLLAPEAGIEASLELTSIDTAALDAAAAAFEPAKALAGRIGPVLGDAFDAKMAFDGAGTGTQPMTLSSPTTTVQGFVRIADGVIGLAQPMEIQIDTANAVRALPEIGDAFADAGVDVVRAPRIEIDVTELSVPIAGLRGNDLSAGRLSARLRTSEASARVRGLPGSADAARTVSTPSFTMALESTRLGDGVAVSGGAALLVDAEPSGTLDVALSLGAVLDAAGAYAGGVPSFDGTVVASGVPAALLQPLAGDLPLKLAEDVGPTIDARLVAETDDADPGAQRIEATLNAEHLDARLVGRRVGRTLTVTSESGPGGRISMDGLSGPLGRVLGDTATLARVDPLVVTIDRAAIDMDRPTLHGISAEVSVRLRRIAGTLGAADERLVLADLGVTATLEPGRPAALRAGSARAVLGERVVDGLRIEGLGDLGAGSFEATVTASSARLGDAAPYARALSIDAVTGTLAVPARGAASLRLASDAVRLEDLRAGETLPIAPAAEGSMTLEATMARAVALGTSASGPVDATLAVTLTRDAGKPLGSVRAAVGATLGGGALEGPVRIDARASGVWTGWLNGLTERPNLVVSAIGLSGDATIDATLRPGASGGFEGLDAEVTLTTPRVRTEGPVRLSADGDGVTLGGPAALTWTVFPGFVQSLAGARTLSLDAETVARLRINALTLPGTGSGETPSIDLALDADPFALVLPGGERRSYTAISLAARTTQDRSLGVVATIDEGEQRALGSSMTIGPLVAGAYDDARVTGHLRFWTIPASAIDAVAGADGAISDGLGGDVDLLVRVDDFPADGSTLTARAVSQRSRISYAGRVTDGRLVATEPSSVRVTEIDQAFGFRIASLIPVFGTISKTPGTHAPASLTFQRLAIPLDLDMRRLDGAFRVDPGGIGYAFDRGLLALAGPGALGTDDLGASIGGFGGSIESGVLSYRDLTIPIGEFTVPVSGLVNLVDGSRRIVLRLPTGALAEEGIGQRLPILRELLNVPVSGVGRMGEQIRWKLDPGAAREGDRKPEEQLLEEIGRGLGDLLREQIDKNSGG